MNKLGNLPAFPVPLNDGESFVSKADCDGMSIRQYATIKAMQGLLANNGGPMQANSMCGWSLCNCTESDVAVLSVKLADALLAELEK